MSIGDAEALVVGVVARRHLHVLLLVAKVLDPPREVPLTHVLGCNLYMVGMKSLQVVLTRSCMDGPLAYHAGFGDLTEAKHGEDQARGQE